MIDRPGPQPPPELWMLWDANARVFLCALNAPQATCYLACPSELDALAVAAQRNREDAGLRCVPMRVKP